MTEEEKEMIGLPDGWHIREVTPPNEQRETCVNAAEWLAEDDEPDTPLIHGLIEKGEMFAVVGQSKAGKSFLALQMAVCASLGVYFLGRKVERERVYVANLEVSRKQYIKRLRRLVKALDASLEDLDGWLFVDNMKGESATWKSCLGKVLKHKCGLAVIDPFYQIFKGDEVNSEDCRVAIESMKVYQRHGITLGVVFHSQKGFSGDRALIDMISGSSMLARFPESIIGLLNSGKDRDARVLKCILRNYAPTDDVTVRYDGGQFVIDETVEAVVESEKNRATATRKRETISREEFVANVRRWGAEIAARLIGVGEADIKGEMVASGLSANVADKVFAAITETAGAYGMRYDDDYGTFNWK